MRQQSKDLLKVFMAKKLKRFRTKSGLVQETLAEMLWISPRAYIYLEKGKYNFSVQTFILFLLCMKDDEILTLLAELRIFLMKVRENEDD